ncbi:TonB-dependent receptor [Asticcacaulis sp. AC402]|uniref:TonB-dependent receptor n=1 Tax=Asticcacaulis sp. AC402 TaxID=1282361 RepID=UPI0003C3F1B7|nr:TonB-dependent receptor [Asticcacaulis sp. AC402]ESQ73756.1 hypothetical protein ABAC402_17590 [Asticcacaulis sp. AC402]
MFRRTRLVTSLSVLALSSALVTAVHAQDVEDAPVEVVITGTAYGVSKDALMSNVDILTRDDISRKPSQGLGAMLATLPGVRSSAFAPGASRPSIRGLDGFRVLVLNNGMGAVDASAVSPDHAVSTDPMEARRIEVLRGPSALIYGGNAIGGIVNIIDDRIATTVARPGVEGRVTAQASSVDKGTQLGFNAKTGTGPLVFTFDALRRTSEDYDTPVGPESRYMTDSEGEPRDIGDHQDNTAVDLENYGAGVSYIGDFGFIGLSAKTTDLHYGVPGHAHGEEEGPVTIGLKQTRYDVRSQFNLAFAGFNKLQADGGYSDYEHTEFEGDETGTQFFSTGHELRVSLLRSQMGALSGTVGFNLSKRDFEAIGDEAFVPSTTTDEVGVFTQYRLDNGTWGVEGGARLDRKAIKAVTGFSRDFDNLSASLGGFWRPSDHAFFGLSLTRSERAPSDVELLADGPHAGTGAYELGNAAFDSEVGNSLELTGHWLMDEHSAFTLDAHLYTSNFDGFIDLRPTGEAQDGLPVFAYVQTGANFHGFELEGGGNLWSGHGQVLRLDLTYDYVHGKSDLGPIARIAPSALAARLSYEAPKWDAHAEVRHVADANDLAAFELPTDGYTAVNLFASYHLTGATSVFAEVRNLTDTEIREHTSVQKDIVVGAGRSLRVGMIWNF